MCGNHEEDPVKPESAPEPASDGYDDMAREYLMDQFSWWQAEQRGTLVALLRKVDAEARLEERRAYTGCVDE